MAPKRILIVDDDAMTVDAAISHCRIQNHVVDYVADVSEALDCLRWNNYDVIFLDVMLACGSLFTLEDTDSGRYTGLRIVELIRTHDDYKHHHRTKVALVTNWRGEPQVETTAAKFRCLLLQKPLSLDKLDEVIG